MSFHPARQMSQRKGRAGFTIVELLVATAVTAVLAGLLLTMTNGVLRSWNRTSGSLSANSQAQLIFDVLAEDLQSVVYRNDGGVWMAVDILQNTTDIQGRAWTVTSGSGSYKPAGVVSQDRESVRLADSRYGLGGAWLRFFSTGSGAQPQAISYQLARRKITGNPTDNTNPAEARYMLYRSEIGAATTFERGYNLDPTLISGTEGYNNVGNPLIVPPRAEIIGNNVIDFGVRLYSRNGFNLEPVFPVNNVNEWNDNHTRYLANGRPFSVNEGPFPDVVDVMVRILTEEGARQIQSLEEGMLPPENGNFDATWWRIAEAHSQVFTRRIYVNARPF